MATHALKEQLVINLTEMVERAGMHNVCKALAAVANERKQAAQDEASRKQLHRAEYALLDLASNTNPANVA